MNGTNPFTSTPLSIAINNNHFQSHFPRKSAFTHSSASAGQMVARTATASLIIGSPTGQAVAKQLLRVNSRTKPNKLDSCPKKFTFSSIKIVDFENRCRVESTWQKPRCEHVSTKTLDPIELQHLTYLKAAPS